MDKMVVLSFLLTTFKVAHILESVGWKKQTYGKAQVELFINFKDVLHAQHHNVHQNLRSSSV